VTGGADQLDSSFEGLVVRAPAGEGGEEAVMNVDDPSGIAGTELARDDLHESGQHHHVTANRLEERKDLVECLLPAVGGDRHVNEVDAVPLDQ
jgi:hypothetical protein